MKNAVNATFHRGEIFRQKTYEFRAAVDALNDDSPNISLFSPFLRRTWTPLSIILFTTASRIPIRRFSSLSCTFFKSTLLGQRQRNKDEGETKETSPLPPRLEKKWGNRKKYRRKGWGEKEDKVKKRLKEHCR